MTKKKFCSNFHCNGANSYLFFNGRKINKFKAKDSEIMASPLFLETGQQIIWKKTGFNVYVYDFSVDYDATDVDDIVDIHNYLMKKNNIV